MIGCDVIVFEDYVSVRQRDKWEGLSAIPEVDSGSFYGVSRQTTR